MADGGRQVGTVPARMDTRTQPETGTPGSAPVTVVLDTCVLLSDPHALYRYPGSHLVLPLTVIEELDGQKNRLDDVGRAARTAARLLEELRVGNGGDLRSPVAMPGGGDLRIEFNGLKLDMLRERGLAVERNDNRILAAALGQAEHGEDVVLVSNDVNMRLKASAMGLRADEHHGDRNQRVEHPGWYDLEVDADTVNEIYQDRRLERDHPGLDELDEDASVNEFVVLHAGQQSALCRIRPGGVTLVRRNTAWGLTPRAKEQQFALELLMEPTIPIVGLSGAAGTGKTILALAAGLEQTFEPQQRLYDRMMILRPVIAVGKQELGFLPGDLEDKLGPWFSAVLDALVALGDNISYAEAKQMLDGWVHRGSLSLEAVSFLRGRSLQRTYVLVDEAQNLEALTLKTILTRIGEGSKVVFVGDMSQIDNPYVGAETNALATLIGRFRHEELFGYMHLTRGERSAVADRAAHLL